MILRLHLGQSLIPSMNPADKLFAFNTLFNDVLVQHAPVKIIRIRGRPNPYVTEEIRAQMRTRDEWKRAFKRTKDPLAGRLIRLLSIIRMAEREFVAKQIRNNKNNTNSLWKSIRSCIPKKSVSQKTYSKDTKILADEFNHFFFIGGRKHCKEN